MPIFEYECVKCKRTYERLSLGFRTQPDATCVCGAIGERRFSVPAIRTETTRMAGAKYGAEQFAGANARVKEQYLGPARDAGVSVNGKIYQAGLAQFPGDPAAWCSNENDVKRRAIELGAECPSLGVKAREMAPLERKGVTGIAEDLVDERIGQRIAAGEMDIRDAEKLRNEVADSLLPAGREGMYKDTRSKRKKSKKK